MAYRMNSERKAKADANRAHVLAVARKLFEAEGFENVSLRDVAAASGNSVGVIFTYWRGKEAMFAEAMGRPYFNDARGAEAFEALKRVDINEALAMLQRWGFMS